MAASPSYSSALGTLQIALTCTSLCDHTHSQTDSIPNLACREKNRKFCKPLGRQFRSENDTLFISKPDASSQVPIAILFSMRVGPVLSSNIKNAGK